MASTYHLCSNQNWFSSYELVRRNNEPCKIASIGKVRLKMFDGAVRTLDLVRHVPRLNRNIIFLSTLNLKE